MTAIVLIVSALLVLADQLIKLWVLAALPGAPSVTLIPGLLQLTYVENRGAAFGIFQGRVGLLSIVTLAVIAVPYGCSSAEKSAISSPCGAWGSLSRAGSAT